ncbi:MAG: hypothetical protein MRZ65_02005 [Lachnospiraceae bacterium]|nr:hypothetical protein [Lachnospiraceae bacterium]
MKRIREIIVGFLVISMVLGNWMIPPTTAEATKKENEVTQTMIKEAKTAYAKFLKENKGIKKFTVWDVIGDDMPELITVGKKSISEQKEIFIMEKLIITGVRI